MSSEGLERAAAIGTKDYGFDFWGSVQTEGGRNVANHLLRELMAALGEPDHARPESPRTVWKEMLGRVIVLADEIPKYQGPFKCGHPAWCEASGFGSAGVPVFVRDQER